MSADLDGGAAPASLDDLVVVDSLTTPAEDGGPAPHDDSADAGTEADAAVLAEAEDAGPAPEPQD